MSRSRKLRVLVLTHQDLVPPESVKGIDLSTVEWRAEYDVVKTLKELKHEVHVQGVLDDPKVIRNTVEEWKPHLAFNLLEEFAGEALFDQNVVAYLELIKMRYTGCNPRGLMLARHKGLAKMVLSYHRIPTPKFEIFPKNQSITRPKNLEFPLFIKSLTEEASAGISQGSIVHNDDSFVERVQFIHESIGSDAIAESYIKGREFYVGVLGNIQTEILPVWELDFGKTPDQIPKIATQRVKFNPKYRKKYGITTDLAEDLPEQDCERIRKLCKRVYRILGLNGYARMDLRLHESGKIYLLEANPNPHIGEEEDFAQSALSIDVEYPDLISKILRLGLRWQPHNLST